MFGRTSFLEESNNRPVFPVSKDKRETIFLAFYFLLSKLAKNTSSAKADANPLCLRVICAPRARSVRQVKYGRRKEIRANFRVANWILILNFFPGSSIAQGASLVNSARSADRDTTYRSAMEKWDRFPVSLMTFSTRPFRFQIYFPRLLFVVAPEKWCFPCEVVIRALETLES